LLLLLLLLLRLNIAPIVCFVHWVWLRSYTKQLFSPTLISQNQNLGHTRCCCHYNMRTSDEVHWR
jgi:hypothetical protein